MCYPNPGWRCAHHTAHKIERLERSIEHARDQRINCLQQKDSLVSAKRTVPLSLERKIERLSAKIEKDQWSLKVAHMDYDGTRTGSNLIESRLSGSIDDQEAHVLKGRQRKAAMLRAWRAQAVKRAKVAA